MPISTANFRWIRIRKFLLEIHRGVAAPLVEFHPTFYGTTCQLRREEGGGYSERRTEGHRDKTSGTGETPV